MVGLHSRGAHFNETATPPEAIKPIKLAHHTVVGMTMDWAQSVKIVDF